MKWVAVFLCLRRAKHDLVDSFLVNTLFYSKIFSDLAGGRQHKTATNINELSFFSIDPTAELKTHGGCSLVSGLSLLVSVPR